MARRTSVANTVISRGEARAGATPCTSAATPAADYFVEKDGLTFAGLHVLLDFWGCRKLDAMEAIEAALRAAIVAAGATILELSLHRFTSSGGISGVAILAESHISIHTWPERGYAAFDIFMCGGCDPYKAIPVLREVFQPDNVQLHEQRRGITV